MSAPSSAISVVKRNKKHQRQGVVIMKKFVSRVVASLLLSLGCVSSMASQSPSSLSFTTPAGSVHSQSSNSYGRLPLRFEANRGQTDEQVRFLSRGPGYSLFLTPAEAVLSLSKPLAQQSRENVGQLPLHNSQRHADVLRRAFMGANKNPVINGNNALSGKSHYLLGSDAKTWRTNVSQYAQVQYRDIYPGIDLVFYGRQRQLEYDFIVAPGADPERIRLSFEGARDMHIGNDGSLILQTSHGELIQHKPVIYQEFAGKKITVAGDYLLHGKQVSFKLASYDNRQPLIIDPVLSYSTYLGGSGGDSAYDIAIDSAGNAYVTGETLSADFPTTAGAYDKTCGSNNVCNPNVLGPTSDAFVAKLNAAGTGLIYSTYLGGNSSDLGRSISVNSNANAYITGTTSSTNFPTTSAAYDRSCGTNGLCNGGSSDVFIAKLNPAGNGLVYSTYLGGSDFDQSLDHALDSTGNSYVTGDTFSANFPIRNGFRATAAGDSDVFVTKLNAAGNALIYSTYLGGGNADLGRGIAVNETGNAYITGQTYSTNFPTRNPRQATRGGDSDVFVTQLGPLGNTLVYSTYLGGRAADLGLDIVVDGNGSAYVAGTTSSNNFPTIAGSFDRRCGTDGNCNSEFNAPYSDAFVSKLNPAGTGLVYSTYLGGSVDDAAQSLAINDAGKVYVTGETSSEDFPVKNALQATQAGSVDAFVTKLNVTGSALGYSTYLGGNDEERARGIALDGAGNVYLAGISSSANFPTTRGAYDRRCGADGSCLETDDFGTHVSADAFVAKVANSPAALTLRFDAGNYTVREGEGRAIIRVTRNGDASVAVSVKYASSNGTALAPTDYTAAQGMLSFPAGIVTKTFNVRIIDDTTAEPNETIRLILSSPAGAA